jgi:transketolase
MLPPHIRDRVAVEAGHRMSWDRWLGLDGVMVGMDTFGASAPSKDLYAHFGITAKAVAARVRELIGR